MENYLPMVTLWTQMSLDRNSLQAPTIVRVNPRLFQLREAASASQSQSQADSAVVWRCEASFQCLQVSGKSVLDLIPKTTTPDVAIPQVRILPIQATLHSKKPSSPVGRVSVPTNHDRSYASQIG